MTALAKGEVAAPVLSEILRSLVLLLAPFAPYLAAEMWQEIGGEGAILRTAWPKFDEALAKEEEIEIPVQVNGKLRSLVRVAAEATPVEMEKAALGDGKLQAVDCRQAGGEGDRGAGQDGQRRGQVAMSANPQVRPTARGSSRDTVAGAYAGRLLAAAFAVGAGGGVALAVWHPGAVAAVSRGVEDSGGGAAGVDRHTAVLAAGSMESRGGTERYMAAVMTPLIVRTAIWLVPLLSIAWAVVSGVGASLVLRRFDASLPFKPLSLIVLQLLRVVALGAVFAAWYFGLQWAATATLSGPGEPNLLAYLALVICLTLGIFTAWSMLSWVFFIAPLLVLLERISPMASLWRSARLGREFTGKLVEVNLVMGIVKLALIVLAMVLSATPLPFQIGDDGRGAAAMVDRGDAAVFCRQ